MFGTSETSLTIHVFRRLLLFLLSFASGSPPSLSSLLSLFFLSYVSRRLLYSFVLPSTFFCLFLVSVITDDFVFLLFTCFVLVFEHEVANDNHPRWMRVDISRVHFSFLPFHVDCLCRFLEWRTLEHVIDAEPARVTCCRGCVLCRKFEAPACLSISLSISLSLTMCTLSKLRHGLLLSK